MKSEELLKDFTEYCATHKEERFWQALRNWCGYSFIYVSQYPRNVKDVRLFDTFYWTKKTQHEK